MFRELRRKGQLISDSETIDVIERNTCGTLSVSGDSGYPYGVPLNHAYKDGKLYFHCAKAGHKLDAIKKDAKVCYTVVDADEVVPQEFNTMFRSAVVFGKARIITDEDEITEGLRIIVDKFSPKFKESGEDYIKEMFERVCVFIVDIEHMTGKQAKELF